MSIYIIYIDTELNPSYNVKRHVASLSRRLRKGVINLLFPDMSAKEVVDHPLSANIGKKVGVFTTLVRRESATKNSLEKTT